MAAMNQAHPIGDATASPFYPPFPAPPKQRPGFLGYIFGLSENALKIVPEAAYQQPLTILTDHPPHVAYVSDPDLVKIVLLDRADDFPKDASVKRVFKPLIGNGILTAEGKDWHWQRRTAAPLFRREELMQYVPTMVKAAEATIEKWRTAPPGTPQDVDRDMMRATFHVISNAILAGGGADVMRAIETGRDGYMEGINWWFIYSLFKLPHWMPRPHGRLVRAQERRLRQAVGELIRTRRQARDKRDDLCARLLTATDPKSGRAMSDEQLVDNLLTFLLAGFDTTATSLTWALYLLSQSPDWEARILEEVRRVVPSGPLAAEHIEQLATVQQVIKEAMRLYPAAPLMQRYAVADTELGGEAIKAGTILVVPICAIHRHRKLWPEPDRFDPSRFSAENEARHARFQFMPFGAGPRICIGAAYAMLEATAILAMLVREARFDLAGFAPEPVARMFLVPKNGMPMKVTLRTQAH